MAALLWLAPGDI